MKTTITLTVECVIDGVGITRTNEVVIDSYQLPHSNLVDLVSMYSDAYTYMLYRIQNDENGKPSIKPSLD